MKRKMERMLVLFLATMILVLTIGTTETIWPAKHNDQSRNIELNMRVQAEFLPNDPYWSYQWGPKKIEADWAWNATVGSSNILVAIIDSGIGYNHPDLAANYVALGYDWVNNDPDPMDDFGHGTKVAGILCAVTNNGIGIAGLAQVKMMAEKVLNSTGWGDIDQLANGIYHATDMGAKIISMSLSTPSNDSLLYDAVKYAYNAGVLLVAAAGNQASNTKRYPAAYDEVIAVSATEPDDNTTDFTNFGDWIELAAPGRNIFTTTLDPSYYYGEYDYATGTSVACPQVSGLAGLIWSEFSNASRDWVRNRLRDTADDLGPSGFDQYYGYGRINARKAIYGTSPAINYTLTITTTAGGTTNPLPGNYTHSQGQNVLVQAMPNPGYGFDHWNLDEANVGSTNPYSVLMNSNHTLGAVFIQINYTLTITTATTGGTTNPLPGVYKYAAGSNVIITAIPSTNYRFGYWELDFVNIGATNPINVEMDKNHTLQAIFILLFHDVAVTNVTPLKTVVGQGYSMSINVTVKNQGDYPEIFNITVYADTTSIGSQTVTLISGVSTTITLSWNTTGFTMGNYTISASTTQVTGEINIADDTLIGGTIRIVKKGDLNGDNNVNVLDLILVAAHLGHSNGNGHLPLSKDWYQCMNTDINNDNQHDVLDLILVANYLGT